MRRITNPNIAQLLVQVRFAPQKQRRIQLERAEDLLAIIEPNKEYPFEFVCFRITGHRPKDSVEQHPIKGDELLEDLRVFISKLSGQIARQVTEQNQRVFTVEELAELWDVSTKTIHRWRKRGLTARKFIFDDGKKRLGFLQSAVDKFVREKPNIVAKGRVFSRMKNTEKQLIVKQAAELADKTTMSRHQIINKIAAQTGKAHETVRYTLLNYEKANPDKHIFNKGFGVMTPAKSAELFKLFKQGCGVKELMKRFHRSKSSIYRIINYRRAKALLASKIEFITSDEFLEEGTKERILAKPISREISSLGQGIELLELTGDFLLPKYLQTLKDTPVLKREREIELFRRYNYLKYSACLARAGLDPYHASSSRLKQIEDYLRQAEKIKKMIIEANLRLIVSIAGKHVSSGTSFSDLVSKGNFSLVKAVEHFDYTKGVRFGTYASWTIAKDYAAGFPSETTRLDGAARTSLANIQHRLRKDQPEQTKAIEQARKSLVQVVKDELDEREQHIILNHFGLVGSPVKKKKKTLKQIGDDLGLTKERVRQIELIALQKLRQCLSIKEFELLTG